MAEKKENRSAIRSRRLIREALLELLQEKKFEKITVTDIVKRADINRSTFYAHYPDVMGLLEELMED
ncbi:MAG: TetR family transcriptional regulator, partial [Lachnospiraceae bacterium]|nr:TetR family transcriptional regulator [Lachnospiraceae bacterium]